MNLNSRNKILRTIKALNYRLKATRKGDLRTAKKWERIWNKRVRRLSGDEFLHYIDELYYRRK